MFEDFRLSKLTKDELNSALLDRFLGTHAPLIVNTLNPHSFLLSQADSKFKKALINSDVILIDGIGIILAEFLLHARLLKRYTGPDFFTNTLDLLSTLPRQARIGIIGPNDAIIDKAVVQIEQAYENISVQVRYAPPYLDDFDDEAVRDISGRLKKTDLDVLWICIGAPKQEKIALDLASRTNTKVIAGVGAALSFFTGDVLRAPALLRILGLEWLHRSIMSPSRLGMRNLSSNPKFLFEIFKRALSKEKFF